MSVQQRNHAWVLGSAFATFAILSAGLIACNGGGGGNDPAGKMTVKFPDAETIQFEAILSQDSNFTLDGTVLVPPYGDLYFSPANGNQGFTFGGHLNIRAFLPDGWKYAEVTKLPTGAYFPGWVKTGLIGVPVKDNFNVYLGVTGDKYLGVGWGFITSKDIPVGIGANYRDKDGNIVVGGLFYPPLVEGENVTVPGGLFLGTNLTPFINKLQKDKIRLAVAENMLTNFGNDGPVTLDGQELHVSYFAVEPGSKKSRSVRSRDADTAQKYLKLLRRSSKKAGHFEYKAE